MKSKPAQFGLVSTGVHDKPDYLYDHAVLASHLTKENHPIDAGQRASKGTEY